MAVLMSRGHETTKLEKNLNESLIKAQVETAQLLADLKNKEAVALEMIAILRGVRGLDARHDRKSAQRVLAKVKQRRTLAERSLVFTSIATLYPNGTCGKAEPRR